MCNFFERELILLTSFHRQYGIFGAKVGLDGVYIHVGSETQPIQAIDSHV